MPINAPMNYSTLHTIRVMACLLTAVTVRADVSPPEAKKTLQEGNTRFAAGQSLHPAQDAARRAAVAKGQKPLAVIVSCSDSRVAPELIFDRGLGDLFVVRVAGNVVNTDQIGSAEYGIEHLEARLLIVLGHSACGAVAAVASGAQVHGHIRTAIQAIAPAVARAKAESPRAPLADLVALSVTHNVFHTVEALLHESDILAKSVAEGKTRVEGAVYDLESGRVTWLGAHPEQARLLASRPKSSASPH